VYVAQAPSFTPILIGMASEKSSDGWVLHTIPYTFAYTGSDTWRLMFKSVSSGGSVPDGGNFLDDVHVNLAEPQIYGPSTVCQGAIITLSDDGPGGTWSCAPASIATVNTNGDVSALAPGTATIVYTFPNGCTAAYIVTVEVCPGTDCSILCNGSFESPQVADVTNGYQDFTNVPCWKTTQAEGIEFRTDLNSTMPAAYDGHQYIELNAESVGTISQGFIVTASSATLTFAHKGRYHATPDHMGVEVYTGGVGGVFAAPLLAVEVQDNDSAWRYYSMYIPGPFWGEGKVVFKSVSSQGAPSGGNYLDSVKLCVLNNTTSVNTVPGSEDNIIRVFPNPTDGLIHIATGKPFNNATVRILDVPGQVVIEQQHLNGTHFTLDITNLANGMYIVEINNDGVISRSRVAKD
jgi:hypothetical protein